MLAKPGGCAIGFGITLALRAKVSLRRNKPHRGVLSALRASNSARRLPPARLRYLAAEKGKPVVGELPQPVGRVSEA